MNFVDMAGLFNQMVGREQADQERAVALQSPGQTIPVRPGDFQAVIAKQARAPGITDQDLADYQGVAQRTRRAGDDAAMRARVMARAFLSTPEAAADPRMVMAAGEQARADAVGDFFKGAALAQHGYGEETKRAEQGLREYGLKVTEPQKEAAAMKRAKLASDTELSKAQLGAKVGLRAPVVNEILKLEVAGEHEKARNLRKNLEEEEKRYRQELRPAIQGGTRISVVDQKPADESKEIADAEARTRKAKALSGLRSSLGYNLPAGQPAVPFSADTLLSGLAANPELASDPDAVNRLLGDLRTGSGGKSAQQIQQELFRALIRRANDISGGAQDQTFGGLQYHSRKFPVLPGSTYAVTEPGTNRTLMARDVYGAPFLQGYRGLTPAVRGETVDRYRRELELGSPILKALLAGGQ
jgi:hypothetical protein